jgi:single-strand DNA-binding protein
VNTIVVCGYIGRDPELGRTKTSRSVVRFSIAEQRGVDTDGQEITQWFNCRAYDRTAELIHEHFAKGKPIYVEGSLHARLYAREDGTAGLSIDVQVSRFEFVPFGGKRREDDPAEPTPPAPRPASNSTGASAPATPTDAGDFDVPDITDPFADQ